MNNFTEEQWEALKEKLNLVDEYGFSAKGSHITIGTVLLKAKMFIKEIEIIKLNDLWIDVFGNVSLNEIVSWEFSIKTDRPLHKGGGYPIKRLKPEANKLLLFINKLFIDGKN